MRQKKKSGEDATFPNNHDKTRKQNNGKKILIKESKTKLFTHFKKHLHIPSCFKNQKNLPKKNV